MKRLFKLIFGASMIPALFVFMVAFGGQSVGRATGLKVLNYIPPNLIPAEEIAWVVVQENPAPDLFQLPN
jgi:hypothetical protein